MRTVLVTGGTVRLGAAIAEGLRARGWRVLASSHRPDAGASVVADLSSADGAKRLYADALRLLDGEPPDALVNNAALFTGGADRLRQVDFTSPCELMRLFADRGNREGAIVNLLDCKVLGLSADASSPYLAAKRDLLAATRRAALAYAPRVRVNGVAPGPVLAPVGVHEPAGICPLARRPTPQDVAAAVAYLLEAPSVTGTVIPVDAGQQLVAENERGNG